jgi:hypothetical protein
MTQREFDQCNDLERLATVQDGVETITIHQVVKAGISLQLGGIPWLIEELEKRGWSRACNADAFVRRTEIDK